MEIKSSEKRFALLIDADNVSAKYLKYIIEELSKYGTVTYKRIYGDWTLNLHAKWKDALLENSITPIQQFGYTQGKNATDSAMIIDAMDILYTNSVEGFCIVSSDSDFTRLAARIRESGLTVIGMGEKKTPLAFRKACDIFTTLELLVEDNSPKSRKGKGDKTGSGSGPSIDRVERAVVKIITDNQNNGKATGLGEVGSRLLKRYPDFDVRSYGTNLLSKMLDSFESVRVVKQGSNVSVVLASQDADEAEASPADDAATAAVSSATGEEASATQDGAVAEKPLRGKRRSTRVIKRKRKTTDAEGAEATEAPQAGEAAAAEDAAQAAPETVAAAESATSEEAPSMEPAATADADEPKAKPAKKTSRRSRKKKAEASEAPAETTEAADQASAPAESAEAADQEATTAADSSDTGTAAAEAPAKAKPARKRRKASEKKADEAAKPAFDPEAFIRQEIKKAGDAGVVLSELGKRIRSKEPGFKVSDLGHRTLRPFVASLEGVTVQKQENGGYVAKQE